MPIAYPKFIRTEQDAILYLEQNEKFVFVRNPFYGRYHIREPHANWSRVSQHVLAYVQRECGIRPVDVTYNDYMNYKSCYPTENALVQEVQRNSDLLISINRPDTETFRTVVCSYPGSVGMRRRLLVGRLLYGWASRITYETYSVLQQADKLFPTCADAISALIPYGFAFTEPGLGNTAACRTMITQNVNMHTMDDCENTSCGISMPYFLLKLVYRYIV